MYFTRYLLIIMMAISLHSCNDNPVVSPDYVAELYFDCLQQWQYDKAFDLLSEKDQKNTFRYSYRPESPFGAWWLTCCFVGVPEYIDSKSANVNITLFDILSCNKKKLLCELGVENKQWKIKSLKNIDIDNELSDLSTDTKSAFREINSLVAREEYKRASSLCLSLVENDPFNFILRGKFSLLLALTSINEKEAWINKTIKYLPYSFCEHELVLQLDPNNLDAIFAKGLNTLYGLKDYYQDIDQSITCFELLIDKEPYAYSACYYLTKSYKLKNNKEKYKFYKKKYKMLNKNNFVFKIEDFD